MLPVNTVAVETNKQVINGSLNWREGNSQGREEADALIEVMRNTNNPTLLGARISSLVRDTHDVSGRAILVGFCQRISEELIAL